jgi:plasmid maintenance system antidote protein VapI
MKTNNSVHHGQEVKKRFDQSGLTVTKFAEFIQLSRQTVYNIFKREYIDIPLLERISVALKFDYREILAAPHGF